QPITFFVDGEIEGEEGDHVPEGGRRLGAALALAVEFRGKEQRRVAEPTELQVVSDRRRGRWLALARCRRRELLGGLPTELDDRCRGQPPGEAGRRGGPRLWRYGLGRQRRSADETGSETGSEAGSEGGGEGSRNSQDPRSEGRCEGRSEGRGERDETGALPHRSGGF